MATTADRIREEALGARTPETLAFLAELDALFRRHGLVLTQADAYGYHVEQFSELAADELRQAWDDAAALASTRAWDEERRREAERKREAARARGGWVGPDPAALDIPR